MKKIILIAVLVFAIGGSAGAYYLTQKDDNKTSQSSNNNPAPNPTSPGNSTPATPETTKLQNACDILTQEIANKALGNAAKASEANKEAPRDDGHTVITVCTYTSADNTRTASLLMRIAKDAEGSAHDKEQFGPNKPATAQVLSGYGDSAYWDNDFKQLNILKGTTWYILSSGPTEVPSRTLDQSKQLADLIAGKL